MAVVREDVVKIGFDIEESPLTDLIKQLDDLNKTLKGDFDKNTKKTASGLDKVTSAAKRLGSALGTVALKAGVALGKLTALSATGIGTLATKSVMSFADYEQLVGGVDTLFGETASKLVQQQAKDAYRTAGLSENAYMETVTGFSARLMQSLGGNQKQAAVLADLAIRDMSDNANKMGTDMGSIQYAYQGFAKANYTMLDNLKLGYGGTKEEMERLLKDAEKLTGQKYDISSYADIINAIHAIQTEMGITGTTAEEADKTITGSLNALKGAWGNMMNALVLGGDDFDDCVENLVTTAKTFMKNLMPALTKSLGGIGDLITELAPILEAEFPTLVETLLPPLIKAAASLIRGLITALPTIVKTLSKELPVILSEVWKAVEDVFGDKFPSIKKVGDFFGSIGEFCVENGGTIKKLIPALLGLIGAFKLFNKFKGISSLFGKGGGSGGIFSGFASLGNTKPTQVLKGLANLAIIVGGLALLAIAIAWAAPFIASLSDAKSLIEVISIITVLGLVGSVLTVFAGLVGQIPVTAVLTGLANIALVMGGLTAIVVAFGALNQIDGFSTFLEQGGQTLALLFEQIGLAVGSLVGGALEGLSNSLPAVGTNLSTFAENIKPMFDVFAGVDSAGLGAFIGAMGEFVLLVAGEKFLSLITGGVDYAALGTNLSGMATGLSGFFTAITTIPEGAFEKATALFDCLAGIKALPKEGGIVSWFTGTIAYDSLAAGIKSLASEDFVAALQTLSGIPANISTTLPALFDALGSVSDIPKEGGLWQKLTGDKSTALANIGQALTDFATNAAGFFTAIQNFELGSITAFFGELQTMGGLPDTLTAIDGDVGVALSGMVTTLNTKAVEVYDSGAAIINGLNNGMISALPSLLETVAQVAAAIKSATDTELEIHSPSRVMFESGQFAGQGLVQGLRKTIPDMQLASSDVGRAAVPFDTYTPDSGTIYNSGGNSEVYNISPSFTMTISGTQDDRATARKVKRFVREAFNEALESLDRKTPVVREA